MCRDGRIEKMGYDSETRAVYLCECGEIYRSEVQLRTRGIVKDNFWKNRKHLSEREIEKLMVKE
jgi:hypothetical protein